MTVDRFMISKAIDAQSLTSSDLWTHGANLERAIHTHYTQVNRIPMSKRSLARTCNKKNYRLQINIVQTIWQNSSGGILANDLQMELISKLEARKIKLSQITYLITQSYRWAADFEREFVQRDYIKSALARAESPRRHRGSINFNDENNGPRTRLLYLYVFCSQLEKLERHYKKFGSGEVTFPSWCRVVGEPFQKVLHGLTDYPVTPSQVRDVIKSIFR